MTEFAQQVATLREHLEKNYPFKIHIEASQFKRSVFYVVTVLNAEWVEIPGFMTVLKVKAPELLYCCTHLQDWKEYLQESERKEVSHANH